MQVVFVCVGLVVRTHTKRTVRMIRMERLQFFNYGVPTTLNTHTITNSETYLSVVLGLLLSMYVFLRIR